MDNFDYSIEGADIEYDDGNNPTQIDLLFRAAKTGRFDDFKTTLFSSKLRLNVQDGLGNTALHYAAAGDHPRIAHFILKTDPKVINISNNIGDTPLHKAAGRAKSQVIRLLIDFGGDVLAKNHEDQRPMDIAKDPEVIEMLTPSALGDYSDDEDMDPFGDDGADDDEEDGDESD